MVRYLEAYEPYLKLLMHMNGTNDGTVFTDETGKTVTRYGSTVTKTGTKYLGSASGYFGGNGDYLSFPDSSDFDLGLSNQPFTISFWVYGKDANAAYFVRGGNSGDWGSSGNQYTMLTASDVIYWQWKKSDGTVSNITFSSNPMTATTWTHFAIVYGGTTTTVYGNGTPLGTSVESYTKPSVSSTIVQFGRLPSGTSTYDFAGYLDELAIWKGVAIPISELYPQIYEIGEEMNNFSGVSLGSANIMMGGC